MTNDMVEKIAPLIEGVPRSELERAVYCVLGNDDAEQIADYFGYDLNEEEEE